MVDYGTVHSFPCHRGPARLHCCGIQCDFGWCSGHPRPHAPGSPMEKERGTNLRKSSASLVYNKISAVLDINDTSIISISNIRESSYIFINHIKKISSKNIFIHLHKSHHVHICSYIIFIITYVVSPCSLFQSHPWENGRLHVDAWKLESRSTGKAHR